jgi:CHAT domain-containing protein
VNNHYRRGSWVAAAAAWALVAGAGTTTTGSIGADPGSDGNINMPYLQHEIYQNLANQLINEGRVEQGQQVLERLKELELADDLAPSRRTTRVGTDAIQEELLQFYQPAEVTADGTDLITAGSVLVLQKDNLLMDKVDQPLPSMNTYQKGAITNAADAPKVMEALNSAVSPMVGAQRSASVGGMAVHATRKFVRGEKFFVTKIDTHPDSVILYFISDPIKDVRYRASLRIPFAEGTFPSPDDVAALVSEVIKIDDVPQDQKASSQGGAQGAAAPAVETGTIAVGQTRDQVAANTGTNRTTTPGSLKASGAGSSAQHPRAFAGHPAAAGTPEVQAKNGATTALINLDRKTYAEYYSLRERQAAIGAERLDLERKMRLGTITSGESERLNIITTREFPEINDALTHFFSLLQEQLFSAGGGGHAVEDLDRTRSRVRSAVMEIERVAPNARAVGLQYLWAAGQLTIVLTTAGAPPIVRQVPIERDAFVALIHTARELLRLPKSDPVRLQAALVALHDVVVTPIQADLQAAGAHTLMILPGDFLRTIPFATLTDGKRYLVQDYALTLFSDAVGASAVLPTDYAWRVAGMGATRAVAGLPALPAVRDEIGGILQQPRISGKPYLDDQFTHDQLTRSLGGDFNVLHIASHFILQPGHPQESRLYLGDQSQLSLADFRAQDLRFDHFDLVTFSACETGLGAGTGEYGEELEGLAARVQTQGARAVMATLWKVYDTSTAELMQNFYRARGEHRLNKAEALRAAQLAFIEGYNSTPRTAIFKRPYYWGPFVLVGDWQ